MAFRLYKGVGVGTHWHANNPQTKGGFYCAPGRAPSAAAVVSHVAGASHPSPYISFTASYAVAHAYAMMGPTVATTENQGYIYEIDPAMLTLVDPVRTIAGATPAGPWLPTHHDGGPDLILGIADSGHGAILHASPKRPSGALARPPQVSDDLHALVYAVRDAEVLILGPVPPTCIVAVHLVP